MPDSERDSEPYGEGSMPRCSVHDQEASPRIARFRAEGNDCRTRRLRCLPGEAGIGMRRLPADTVKHGDQNPIPAISAERAALRSESRSWTG